MPMRRLPIVCSMDGKMGSMSALACSRQLRRSDAVEVASIVLIGYRTRSLRSPSPFTHCSLSELFTRFPTLFFCPEIPGLDEKEHHPRLRRSGGLAASI